MTDDVWVRGENPREDALRDEIERLKEKCDKQAEILKKVFPEISGYPFIHAHVGEWENGLPEKLLIVPTYGAGISVVYEKTEKTVGKG